MRILPGLLALGVFFEMPCAFAAAFDGVWVAEIPPQADPCNGTSVMNVIVTQQDVMGQVHTPWGNGTFTGKLDANGYAAISFGSDTGTIQFSGKHFQANWSNARCGARAALGDRAPNNKLRNTWLAERKQSQDRFAELVARAEIADTDYSALRGAYVFTNSWDPYGAKTAAQLLQADAVQKGGDCTAALTMLDDILKIDFTLPAAHALKADCLADSDRAAARTESRIADGLTRSALDSGDGESEKTAYVVNTMHEETDILAKRHIQLQHREAEIRGSDGHFYDEIQGISMRNDVQAHTLYFDVSAFPAGRLSRAAMTSAAMASIH